MTSLNRRRFLTAAGAGAGTLALGAGRLLAGQRSVANAATEIVVVGAPFLVKAQRPSTDWPQYRGPNRDGSANAFAVVASNAHRNTVEVFIIQTPFDSGHLPRTTELRGEYPRLAERNPNGLQRASS